MTWPLGILAALCGGEISFASNWEFGRFLSLNSGGSWTSASGILFRRTANRTYKTRVSAEASGRAASAQNERRSALCTAAGKAIEASFQRAGCTICTVSECAAKNKVEETRNPRASYPNELYERGAFNESPGLAGINSRKRCSSASSMVPNENPTNRLPSTPSCS